MFFIVAHHYVVNSGLTALDGPIAANATSWRSLFLLVFGAWGKTGINCFVLITGYFMCKSEISAKKFCKLLFIIEFYKIVFWLIFTATGYQAFSLKGLAKAFLPVTQVAQNFGGCFLIFFLCIPFLNVLLRGLNERRHIKLLLLCAFTYVGIGSCPFFSVTMNYVSWFIVLYFIGAYIRLYERKIFENAKFWRRATAATFLLSVASVVMMTFVGDRIGINVAYFWVSDSNKILAVALGVSAFLYFKNLKLRYSPFVNAVGATTFGVLLIHANSDVMRRWLWQDVCDNVGFYDSPWLILRAFGSVAAIFAVCSTIDYLRIRFVEKPFFKLWDKYEPVAKAKYAFWENRVCDRFGVRD